MKVDFQKTAKALFYSTLVTTALLAGCTGRNDALLPERAGDGEEMCDLAVGTFAYRDPIDQVDAYHVTVSQEPTPKAFARVIATVTPFTQKDGKSLTAALVCPSQAQYAGKSPVVPNKKESCSVMTVTHAGVNGQGHDEYAVVELSAIDGRAKAGRIAQGVMDQYKQRGVSNVEVAAVCEGDVVVPTQPNLPPYMNGVALILQKKQAPQKAPR